jgi:hypothetical protein
VGGAAGSDGGDGWGEIGQNDVTQSHSRGEYNREVCGADHAALPVASTFVSTWPATVHLR